MGEIGLPLPILQDESAAGFQALSDISLPHQPSEMPEIDKASSIQVCSRSFEGAEPCADARSDRHCSSLRESVMRFGLRKAVSRAASSIGRPAQN